MHLPLKPAPTSIIYFSSTALKKCCCLVPLPQFLNFLTSMSPQLLSCDTLTSKTTFHHFHSHLCWIFTGIQRTKIRTLEYKFLFSMTSNNTNTFILNFSESTKLMATKEPDIRVKRGHENFYAASI